MRTSGSAENISISIICSTVHILPCANMWVYCTEAHWKHDPLPVLPISIGIIKKHIIDIYRAAGALHEIFIQVWRTGHIPSDWKVGILIALYKGKGPKVDSYSALRSGQSLFPRPLGPYSAAHWLDMPPRTVRFCRWPFHNRRHTGTALTVRTTSRVRSPIKCRIPWHSSSLQLREQMCPLESAPEQRCPSYPPRSNKRALYDGSAVWAHIGQELSGHLLTTSGVRQGCVLAPSLFCIAIDWILWHMTSRPEITVRGWHNLPCWFTYPLPRHPPVSVISARPRECSVCAFHGQRLKFKMSALDHSHRLFWSTEIPWTLSRPSHISEVYSHRWILPTRSPQADHFGLLSNVVFGLYLEGMPATPSHQNTRLSCSRPVRPTLCLRDMDSHFSRCQVPGGIPYEMPTQNPENLVEAIRLQLGNICSH